MTRTPKSVGHRRQASLRIGRPACASFRVDTEPGPTSYGRPRSSRPPDRQPSSIWARGHPGVPPPRRARQRRCRHSYRVQAKARPPKWRPRPGLGECNGSAGEACTDPCEPSSRKGVARRNQVEVLVGRASCAERREDASTSGGRRRMTARAGFSGGYLGPGSPVRPGQHGIDHGHTQILAAEGGPGPASSASSRRSASDPRPTRLAGERP